jgi:G3E family GTPase
MSDTPAGSTPAIPSTAQPDPQPDPQRTAQPADPPGGPKPLWIIGGFLGSGKTTVLNRLLRSFAPEPVGVLVNDFGSVGVDAGLVEARDGVQVVDLNGGQIFCSCISGSFVERLVELAATPATAILVESSGMAKPGAMGAILDEVARRTTGALRYAGMVTVVDAPRFARLRTVVNAVDEQVAYADLVVINKCDETDAVTIAAVREAIAGIRDASGIAGAGATEILETSWGELTRADLPRPAAPVGSVSGTPAAAIYRGWGGAKPLCRTWRPETPPTPAQLEALVREWLAAGALRIKGSVVTTEGVRRVNAVPDGIVVTDPREERPSPGTADTAAAEDALVIFEPAPGGPPGRNPFPGGDGPPFALASRAKAVPLANGESCD